MTPDRRRPGSHQRPTPALTRCSECPALYDALDRECPHCGAENRTHPDRYRSDQQ